MALITLKVGSCVQIPKYLKSIFFFNYLKFALSYVLKQQTYAFSTVSSMHNVNLSFVFPVSKYKQIKFTCLLSEILTILLLSFTGSYFVTLGFVLYSEDSVQVKF